MWTALIVDDEALARSNLQLALADHPAWRCVAACASTEQARAVLATTPVDLLLLDIRMPRQHGLAFAEELASGPQPPLVVFVTAHDDHAVAAFELFALDYLLKPFDDQRFVRMLQRAEQVLQQQAGAALADSLRGFVQDRAATAARRALPALQTLVLRSVGRVERIAVADVQWLTAAGNYVNLHLGQRVVLHRSALSALEARLPPGQFLRVHRTALVRPGLIRALRVVGDGSYRAGLTAGVELPVSERHVDAVRGLIAGDPCASTGQG
jgi:two-component system, LytTR family, response regulator